MCFRLWAGGGHVGKVFISTANERREEKCCAEQRCAQCALRAAALRAARKLKHIRAQLENRDRSRVSVCLLVLSHVSIFYGKEDSVSFMCSLQQGLKA